MKSITIKLNNETKEYKVNNIWILFILIEDIRSKYGQDVFTTLLSPFDNDVITFFTLPNNNITGTKAIDTLKTITVEQTEEFINKVIATYPEYKEIIEIK